MKIAFVYPEVYDLARFKERRKEFPPFGVLYLASGVEALGHDVSVFKVGPGSGPLDLRAFDVVGYSVASSATFNIMQEARRTSMVRDDALIMVGGVHCNFYPEMTLSAFDAHLAGIGECDYTIKEVLARAATRDFESVPGLCLPGPQGPRRTPGTARIADLDDLPHPARHLLDHDDVVMVDRLAGTDLRMAHVMFSRGCPFPCRFCAAGETKIQYRSGASARSELVQLIDQYGIDGFSIVDDNFIVDRRKVSEICAAIGDLGLKWSALSRVDTVREDLLRQMAASGCIEVKFGMESGSEDLLLQMNKRTKRQQIRDAIYWAYDAGISPKVFIIHGYPGENRQTTEETIDLLSELKDRIARVSLFRFVPLPGTFAYDRADSLGIRGTHTARDWDGDWAKFHIHHNDRHWWGDDDDFAEVDASYALLRDYIEANWGAQS